MSGSGVQLPKWKSYTLPSWEQVHILREPSKSIHTRKKERIDMSNVNYMIRNDDSRINEGVSYLQRGVNPHVDIMYNNVGGGGGGKTNTMPNIQASNPYKVMKDGAFRPPMFKQEDLLPLSRQKRPETIGITNPGIRSGYNIHNLADVTDKQTIHSSVDVEKLNYIAVRPTAIYKMQLPQEVFTNNYINLHNLKTTATSNVKGYTNDDTQRYNHLQDVFSNSHVNENNLSSSVSSNANSYGNFDAQRQHTNNPHEADKYSLIFSNTSNLKVLGDVIRDDNISTENYIKDNIILKNISPNFSIMIYNPTSMSYNEIIGTTRDRLNIAVQSSVGKAIDLTRDDGTPIKIKDYRWKVVHSAVGRDSLVLHLDSDVNIELNRNTPLYAVGSNISGNRVDRNIETTNIELEKNLPSYNVGTNVSGNTKVERLHTLDPIMSERVDVSGYSVASSKYGRRDAVHDQDANIKLRGMGSVGGMSEITGIFPVTNTHSIPELNSKKIRLLSNLKN